jgi:hypothetical protein
MRLATWIAVGLISMMPSVAYPQAAGFHFIPWGNVVKTLSAGTRVRIWLISKPGTIDGTVKSVNDEAIVVIEGGKELDVERQTVRRIDTAATHVREVPIIGVVYGLGGALVGLGSHDDYTEIYDGSDALPGCNGVIWA